MAEETHNEPLGPQGEGGEGQSSGDPHGDAIDWKAEARKWESRAKENKAKADQFDALEDANKSDLEKAQSRAEKAERELKALKDAQERSKLVKKVSEKTGVPEALIQGDTLEEMEAFAKENAHYFEKQTVPRVGSDGRTPSTDANAKDPIRELFNNR